MFHGVYFSNFLIFAFFFFLLSGLFHPILFYYYFHLSGTKKLLKGTFIHLSAVTEFLHLLFYDPVFIVPPIIRAAFLFSADECIIFVLIQIYQALILFNIFIIDIIHTTFTRCYAAHFIPPVSFFFRRLRMASAQELMP